MNRLEHMLHHRSLLMDSVNAIVDEHIALGRPAENCIPLFNQVELLNQRIRLMNCEIDKLLAIRHGHKDAQREVPLEFQTA
jgi:hypothetical protein